MSDYFYVGFEKKKFGKENNRSAWAKFAIINSESRIASWKREKEDGSETDGENKPAVEPSSDEFHVVKYNFMKVHDDFFNQMLSFAEISHLGHFTSLSSRQFLIEEFSNNFIKNKSVNCDVEDDFTIYKLDRSHYSSVFREFRLLEGKLDTASNFSNILLMGLVSQFDSFISSLIRELAIAKPHILTDSKKEYKAHEIFEFSNLDEFRDNLLEKEIGTILRASHLEQIIWLEKKLNTSLREDVSILPDYIEIFERRNLLAHTNCVVNEQYLKNCRVANFKSTAEVGDKIEISLSYIEKSTEVLMEMGVRLTQTIWRIVAKDDIGENTNAGSVLLNTVFELLCHERYSVAKSILIPALSGSYKYPDSVVECMLQINLATAHMLLDENDEAKRVVEQRDWRAYEPLIRIGVAAIKGETDTVVGLIPEIPEDKISSQNYLEWPVFAKLREDQAFLGALKDRFGVVNIDQVVH